MYREEDHLRWLHRRLRSLDFLVEDEQPAAVRILQALASKEGDITDHAHQHDITLTSVQFDGVLDVIDPAWVRTLIRNGIGSAKGFGFGLLSLRPVH
jgi:CRISPR system Cascade subunit CasE